MRRVLLPAFAVLAALVLQLSVLDRLPLPGGVTPDLVLLVVVAIALSDGPMAGLVTGFCAGLALDIAPPASHLIGLYALVFCLVGYLCGLVSAGLDSSVLLPLGASALGAAGGAALYAAAGVMLGNPDVSGQAVRQVLPLSAVYDVLLSPFVLYAVALASRLAARLTGAVTSPGDLPATGASPSGPGLAGRLGRPGRGLRIPPAARPRDGWVGGGGWLAASAELARSRPATVRLHLGGRGRGALAETARAAAGAPAAAAGSKATPRLRFGSGRRGLRSGRRGDGVSGGGPLGRGLFSRGLSGGSTGLVGITGTGPSRGLLGGRAPRKGTFSGGSARPGSYGGGAPRAGTLSPGPARRGWIGSSRMTNFSGGSPRTTHLGGGSSRMTNFSGGSASGASFGGNSPRRGTFGGSSRRRLFGGWPRRGAPGGSPRGALGGSSSRSPRRGTFSARPRDPFGHAQRRRKSPRHGSLGGGTSWAGRRRLLGVPLPGRSTTGRSGRKRIGGWR